ncbi:MAG: hypothetical protein IPK37_01235 [Austwickia sp.]|jgi:hypothetical protein|nr:MAG: hypothetical protein IPK37_01235 [Austwickia sp.]
MPFGRHVSVGRAARTVAAPELGPPAAPAETPDDPRLRGMLGWLDAQQGPLSILGVCATGDRLVAAALAHHRDVRRLTAVFVEDDAERAVAASGALRSLAFPGLTVVYGDPGLADTYAGRVPADLVLFGSAVVDGSQVRRRGLGEALPTMLTPGGHLAWWSATGTHLAAWQRTLAIAGLDAVAGGPDWGFCRLVDRARALPAGRLYPSGRPA